MNKDKIYGLLLKKKSIDQSCQLEFYKAENECDESTKP